MVWSRRARALSKRRTEGSGSFSRYSENGIISMQGRNVLLLGIGKVAKS